MKRHHPSLAACLALLLSLSLAGCSGCEDCNGMVPTTDALPATSAARYEALSRWADSTRLRIAGDTNLASPSWSLKSRWDSVVDFSRAPEDLRLILSDWKSRTPRATDWTAVRDSTDSAATTSLVKFSVDGISQGAVVRIPVGASGRMPVILFGHPSDDGLQRIYFNYLLTILGPLVNQVIVIAPSYRGETTWMGADSIPSPTVSQSPWDRDVDDAMALLSATLEKVPQADGSRIACIGYSRGAGVSLLASLRDSRIRAVYEMAGPADLFAPSFQKVAIDLINGGTSTLPGIKVLDTLLIKPFAQGRISADSLRRGMLRRSAARWALSGQLPTTTAIHGTIDGVVNFDQSKALVSASPKQATLLPVEGANHTTVLFASTLIPTLETFLKTNLGL
jgi:hypothetical protein